MLLQANGIQGGYAPLPCYHAMRKLFCLMKTLLLTGCNGFLGKALLSRISQTSGACLGEAWRGNYHIIAVDNGITSNSDDPVGEPGKVTYYNENLIHFDTRRLKACDLVVHMAGLASPAQYKKYPLETIDVATTVTRSLLERSVEWNSKIVFFSSSEVYGDPLPSYIPTPESYRGNVACQGPRACYDESKRLGETLCYVYNTTMGVNTNIIRPFNVYGPGMSKYDYRMIPNLLRAAHNNERVSIYGDGTQTRTFCYIDDAIDGICLAITAGKPGRTYNIGTDVGELSMIELVELFSNSIGIDIKLDLIPYPETYPGDEPLRRLADISLARKELDFNPVVTLSDGLKLCWRWASQAYATV